jgi:hypothetical protein
MSTPDTVPGDRPLTIVEIEENQDPLFVLADRLLPHLGGDWRGQLMAAHDVLLTGPEGIKILLTSYGNAEYDPHRFYIETYTATGRPHGRISADGWSIFTLPSQIAAHLNTKIIPATLRRNKTAQQQQAKAREVSAARKAFITAIADKLNWNSSSYKTHSGESYASLDPRHRKRRPRGTKPVLEGHIGYDERKGMHLHLAGLSEDLVDQIVGLLVEHFTPDPEQPETSGPQE